jgi:pantothenate synthetase
MRTPKLVLKTIISLLIYAIAFSNIYKMVPPSTVMLVYDLPNLYIVICLITQIFALSRYKRLQGHADALAASYQRNYLTESESNPQLQQLTRELEESQSQYRELQKQYKERIAAANQRYLEEAEKNFLPKENLIPSKYQ